MCFQLSNLILGEIMDEAISDTDNTINEDQKSDIPLKQRIILFLERVPYRSLFQFSGSLFILTVILCLVMFSDDFWMQFVNFLFIEGSLLMAIGALMICQIDADHRKRVLGFVKDEEEHRKGVTRKRSTRNFTLLVGIVYIIITMLIIIIGERFDFL